MDNVKKIIAFLLLLVSVTDAQTVVRERIQYTSVTPVVSTSPAYTAKDNIGGLMTFAAVCSTSANVQINSVTITDKSDQPVAYDLQLFSANPSSTTFTDNAVTAINAADAAKQLPVISLNTTDHFSYSTTGLSTLSSLDSGGFVTTTGGALYGALVARGTVLPTYVGTSDLVVRLGYKCQ